MALAKRRFRPMGFGDILDEAFDLYKNRFVLLAGIGALIYVPLNFLSGAASAEMMAKGPLAYLNTGQTAAVSEATQSLQQLGFIAALVLFIAYPVVTGAFTYAISQSYLGEATSIGNSYSFILRRIGAVFTTVLLVLLVGGGLYVGVAVVVAVIAAISMPAGVGAAIAVFVLVVAGIAAFLYVFTRLSLAFAALVVEGRKRMDALNRSWQLSAQHGWRMVGILLVTSSVVLIINLIITSAVGQVAAAAIQSRGLPAGQVIMGVTDAIIGLLTAPVMSIVLVLLYYDLRIRKEGFDLQMLARDLAASAGGQAASQAALGPAVETKCAYCRFPIRGAAETTTCQACNAVYHSGCWTEHGGCTTPGCPAAPTGGSRRA